MQKIPQEQWIRRFQILSDTLQDLIFSENAAANIRKVAVLNDVEEDVSLLAELAGQVLMGFLNPADFENELQKELGVEPAIAKQIANQINAEIFSLVQTELRKLYPPTIKTPTVLSKGFDPAVPKLMETPAKPQPIFTPPQLSGFTAKLAPPVKEESVKTPSSEFEKRFFKSAEPTAKPQLSGSTAKLIPVPEDFIKPSVPISTPASSATPTPVISPVKETGQANKITPVIPLPTYIQSQFQKRSGNVIDLRNKH